MHQPTRSLLIIFYRNPKIGKVKTRLAATVGNEKALDVFRKLSLHTKTITENLPYDKIVFYTDSIDLMDMWPNGTYLKALQQGEDLGERMNNAFAGGFQSGYDSICIIGTDCYDLTEAIIREAFDALEKSDAVIGPARDGGYYLLGMKQPCPDVFTNKQWSTNTVFQDTVRVFQLLHLQFTELKVLSDVDTEDDLPESLRD